MNEVKELVIKVIISLVSLGVGCWAIRKADKIMSINTQLNNYKEVKENGRTRQT